MTTLTQSRTTTSPTRCGPEHNVWALTLGVALGPLVGYVLSRGPGLPMYTDDRGNWTEQLGVISLVVEGALLLLAAVMVGQSSRSDG